MSLTRSSKRYLDNIHCGGIPKQVLCLTKWQLFSNYPFMKLISPTLLVDRSKHIKVHIYTYRECGWMFTKINEGVPERPLINTSVAAREIISSKFQMLSYIGFCSINRYN